MTEAFFYSIILALLTTFSSFAEEPPLKVASIIKVLLQAVEDNSVEDFHTVCNEEMKVEATAETLDEVSEQLSEAMLMGYKPEYLGSLNKTGLKVYLWRLNFDVKGIPDMLAELSVSDSDVEKAAGFLVK